MPSPGDGKATYTNMGFMCLFAYILGVGISPYLVPVDILVDYLPFLTYAENASVNSLTSASAPKADTEEVSVESTQKNTIDSTSKYVDLYKRIVGRGDDPFHGVDIVIHRNGEPGPCARQVFSQDGDDNTLSAASKALLNAADQIHEGNKPLDHYDKYDLDAMLTYAFVSDSSILENKGSGCSPTWTVRNHYLDSHSLKLSSEMIKFCDMGIDRTPLQPDHEQMVRVPGAQSLPCHFHTREGVRITSLDQLANFARDAKVPNGECAPDDRTSDGTCGSTDVAETSRRELHLYAVQAGRVFIFAPKYVGEIIELPHVKVPGDLPVWLEVISLQPRVFDIFNFFNREESEKIVEKALKETTETHRMKRSSTGASGYNVNSQRTSENGFDTHGTEAQAVKHRCMDVLGFDTYTESFTDGLQVLRYNKTTAYIPHLDWIDDHHKKEEHNFDSAGLGSNRFATILLYMTDLNEGDGGETVFTHGWPPGQPESERVEFDDALAALRASGDVEGLLAHGSWEEKMVARCRSRLAVRPHSSRAVLFYSQNPDGSADNMSLHGGCPVINGEKWAANLWVWNAPRGGFPHAPVNQEVVERNRASGKSPENLQKKASFTNLGTNPAMREAELFFQDTFWGKLGFGDQPLHVNTYEGHQWNVKVDGQTVKTFVINKELVQRYEV
mmetsp:Transcript_28100/g.59083  ORF Transcript_28100/g.59083 Transcript_28100/m.59083 type:complete len:672 (-) Transcript_28100:131-2146(-)